jgi:mono/diheme cytochrome c family protein
MSRREPSAIARAAGVAISAVIVILGCRQEMHDQRRYEPLEASRFFDDRRASRPRIEGTVARDELVSPESAPPLTAALLARGRERYDIHCSPCHDRSGYGGGMIVRRGFPRPPSFHDEGRPDLEAADIFEIITRGKGEMYPYASRVLPEDRWAIAFYIKALQRSRHAALDDAPPDEREKLLESR